MKTLIKKIVPSSALSAYHLVLAHAAAFWYGHPSEKLVVIGVTGTNGKSTTTEYVGRILEHAGHKVGWTGTTSFKVASREWTNDRKMTMLGRFATQKLLADMVAAGCEYAVIETSSQGIAQSRHVGINYDVAVFTNLTPEHIESHGGFDNYRHAKGRLFAALSLGRRKGSQKKVSVVNVDDEHADYFLSFPADEKIGFGLSSGRTDSDVFATDVALSSTGTTFSVDRETFSISPIGRFNLMNALAAIAACRAVGLSWEKIKAGVASLRPVPGRLESIVAGQPFSVIVDYAPEPAALAALYDALELIEHRRIIHVLGSTGGGRDVARRRILGEMAAKRDGVVIVTNEDPYDDEPMGIVREVAEGAEKAERAKKQGKDLFLILDRQEAIDKAVELAEPGDLVLLTGKGCEPVMAVAGGRKIPWDDRDAARKALAKLGYATHR
ncbi:MAG: UDP-N-acetylmuramyl-tripeptide synthetase [Candidatus Uhrbacteria bacterium]